MNFTQPDFSQGFTFQNGLKMKNRISLSPLTNCQSQADGTLGPDEARWLIGRAQGGFGLIMTCAVYISPTAHAWKNQLGLYKDEQIEPLKELTAQLTTHHVVNIMQIFHGGVRCPSALTGQQPVSASEYELAIAGFETPRALTQAEIKQIIADFAQTTRRAWQAGFDGVELHGANGYLITQFLSTQTNLRHDEYGGSVENRARFAREILHACRQQVPADFLIGIRLSPEGMGLDLDDSLQVATLLQQDGLDFLDLSQGNVLAPTRKYAEKSDQTVLQYFRQALGDVLPIIAGGGVRTAADAEKTLKEGASIVSLGAMSIGNPYWPQVAVNDNSKLVFPPYHTDYLPQVNISQNFIDYMRGLPMKLLQEK